MYIERLLVTKLYHRYLSYLMCGITLVVSFAEEECMTSFMERFRAIRDGRASPRDSFKFRCADSEGHTVEYRCKRPLHEIHIEDIADALLTAAANPYATDVRLHFRMTCTNVEEMHDQGAHFCKQLPPTFDPGISTSLTEGESTGWIQLTLFGRSEMPDDPGDTVLPRA
jgi:hypothetical protein